MFKYFREPPYELQATDSVLRPVHGYSRRHQQLLWLFEEQKTEAWVVEMLELLTCSYSYIFSNTYVRMKYV